MALAGGHTAEQLYARTQQRVWSLEVEHGYEVRQIWGCEWREMLARSVSLRKLEAEARRQHVPGPLDLRKHALFGGRVEPYALRYRCSPAEEIIVLDIVKNIYPLKGEGRFISDKNFPYSKCCLFVAVVFFFAVTTTTPAAATAFGKNNRQQQA